MGLFKQNRNGVAFSQASQPAAVMGAAPHRVSAAGAEALGPDFEPIAGVSLETYVSISKGLAAYNYDQSRAEEVALKHGVDCYSWQEACDGWNARMRGSRGVAQRFNVLYRGGA